MHGDPGTQAVRETFRTRLVRRFGPAAALATVGLIFAALSVQLGIGSLSAPGPGFWPLVVCVVLVGLSVGMGARSASLTADQTGGDHRRSWFGLGVVVLTGVLFAAVGYVAAMAVGVFIWMRFVARESWLMTILLTVCVPSVMYLLFVQILGVRLPIGSLVSFVFGAR